MGGKDVCKARLQVTTMSDILGIYLVSEVSFLSGKSQEIWKVISETPNRGQPFVNFSVMDIDSRER